MTRCPHADIVYCPLYVAAHDPNSAGGCDDGRLQEGECAVARGLDYATAVARLDPRMVAERRFAEQAEASKQQRLANMRANGVHRAMSTPEAAMTPLTGSSALIVEMDGLRAQLAEAQAERDRQYDEAVNQVHKVGLAVLRAEAAESREQEALAQVAVLVGQLNAVCVAIEDRVQAPITESFFDVLSPAREAIANLQASATALLKEVEELRAVAKAADNLSDLFGEALSSNDEEVALCEALDRWKSLPRQDQENG